MEQQNATSEVLTVPAAPSDPPRRFTSTFWWTIGGIALGVLIIGVVWMLAGQNTGTTESLLVSEVSRPAPDFALPALNGDSVRLSDYRGKVVLVNFWATWCVPCQEESPELEKAYQQLRDQGFVIVGVNLRNKEMQGPAGDAEIRAFIERYGTTYPVALDGAGTTARDYQLSVIPTSYFVDPTGTIRYVRVGKLTSGEIVRLFDKIRQQSS